MQRGYKPLTGALALSYMNENGGWGGVRVQGTVGPLDAVQGLLPHGSGGSASPAKTHLPHREPIPLALEHNSE